MAFLGVPPTTFDAYTLPHTLGQITNHEYYNDHKNKNPVNIKEEEEKDLYLMQEKQKRLYMKHKNTRNRLVQKAKQKAEVEVEATMRRSVFFYKKEGSIDDSEKITYINTLGL